MFNVKKIPEITLGITGFLMGLQYTYGIFSMRSSYWIKIGAKIGYVAVHDLNNLTTLTEVWYLEKR